MNVDPTKLEEAIGYQFRDGSLLRQALTHRSYARESEPPRPDNERLEFLGDSILGFAVSERLVERFPEHSEGALTKLRAYLVSSSNLICLARSLDLGFYLLLGRGEERNGGRDKKALQVDALEAIIAALYLDGGFEAAGAFVDRLVLAEASLAEAAGNATLDNYKSALQEVVQTRGMPPPEYRVVAEEGPAHARRFTIEVRAGDLFSTRAEGDSKKSASQRAARLALEQLTRSKEVFERE